jgi:branched-chain amino acid transport system ATP-binding protein
MRGGPYVPHTFFQEITWEDFSETSRVVCLPSEEQQMLTVGRAPTPAPKLLLMDEPSMGLAPVIVEEVFRAIGRIRQMGKTVLLVEQNAVLTLTIADKGYVLELGNIVLTGTGQELLHNPKVEKAYLGV